MNTTKRCDSKTDLPVGLLDKKTRRVVGNEPYKIMIDRAIVAVMVINGKVKNYQRSYGEIRTRLQAVKLCTTWRNKQVKIAQRGY